MRDAIKNGAHDRSELELVFPDKSSSCIQKKFRELLRFENFRRPLMYDEDHRLLEWVASHGRRWKQAEGQFKWRAEGDLPQRYEFLLMPRI
jgi:hypothetical protein